MPVELHINTALSSRDLLGEIDSVKTNDEVRVALDIQGARSPYSRAVFECADGRIVFDAQGVRLEPKR